MSLLISNVNGQNSPGYVFVPAAGANNLRAAHTMCCRIRFTSQPTNIDVVPIAYTADADLGGSWLERRNGDAGGAFFAKRWNAAFTLNDSSSVGGYTTGWQHLAMTYDATNIRTYLNGVLVSTTASLTTRTDSSTSNRLFIGFGGQYVIADCGWFARVLTADEILCLKNNRLGVVLSKGDCFGWYPLFRDSFRTDYSGRGNTLADWTGTGTAPAVDNEDPGVAWLPRSSRRVIWIPQPNVNFSGSATTPSAVTGSTAIRNQFSGAAASPSACTGTLQVRKFFTATACSSTTACTGGLQSRVRFTAGVAASPTACTGTLQARKVFSGACASPTSCTGTLTLLGTASFSGTSTTPTACTANFNVRKPVTSGVATSPTAAAGSFNVRVNMAAASGSPSACSGALRVRKFFAGVATSPTAVTGFQNGGTVVSPIALEDPRNTQNRRAFALGQFRRRGRF